MYFNTNFYVFLLIKFIHAEDQAINLKLHPDEIVNSFKSVISSDYIKTLANEFATKAAEHFINEIETKKKQMVQDYTLLRAPDTSVEVQTESKDDSPNILDEQEALALLNAPSPDGDNLDDEPELTDAEERGSFDKEHNIPVIGVMKINGMYFRRLLGVI